MPVAALAARWFWAGITSMFVACEFALPMPAVGADRISTHSQSKLDLRVPPTLLAF